MTAGNLVDYIVSYTDFHNLENKKESKGKTRLATQADFDRF